METPASPPPWREILRNDPAPLWLLADVPPVDGYVHWDDLVRLGAPDDLTHEQWWVRLKTLRLERARTLESFRTNSGKRFWYTLPPHLAEAITAITPAVAGQDATLDAQVARTPDADLLAEWTMREEAIASAQLAGATLSRSEALTAFDDETLAGTSSGAMAWRTYLALTRVNEWADEAFTPDRVVELNAILTGDGALRTDEDTDVSDPWGRVWHTAPPASEVPTRLAALCRFANGEDGDDLPPLLRTFALTHMAIHDQYFSEANNRTARLLFYWSLARQGYWLARYLSVSKVMLAKAHDYRRSFLLTDTDDGDLTYSFEFQLVVLRRAIWHLRARLESELSADKATHSPLAALESELNFRQLTVLQSALDDPRTAVSYDTHAVYWRITHETARRDLRGLGKRGLIVREKGTKVWQAPADLRERLRGDAVAVVELGDVPQEGPEAEDEGVASRLWRFVRGM